MFVLSASTVAKTFQILMSGKNLEKYVKMHAILNVKTIWSGTILKDALLKFNADTAK